MAAVVTGTTAKGAERGRSAAGQKKLAKANRRGTVIGQELSEIQTALTSGSGGSGGAASSGTADGADDGSGRPAAVSDVTGNQELPFASPITQFAGFSYKGYAAYNKEKQNQDRLLMAFEPKSETFVAAVFDGHGPVGEQVSEVFKVHCAEKFFDKINASPPISHADAISSSIKETEGILFDRSDIDKSFSGSTGVMISVRHNKLVCGNVGDSRVCLARADASDPEDRSKWTAVDVSIDHKPDSPDEMARIRAKGGRVFAEEFDDGVEGPVRVWLGDMDIPGLAMARSLGDAVAKQAGVISDAEMFEVDLSPLDRMIIMGSDGLWEFIENPEVVSIASRCTTAQEAVEVLATEGRKRWTDEDPEVIDDTTVFVAFIRPDRTVDAATGSASSAGADAASRTTAPPAPAAVATPTVAATPGSTESAPSSTARAGSVAAAPPQVPTTGGAGGAGEGDLPAGWTLHKDDVSGKSYYFHDETEQSVWADPKRPGLQAALVLQEKLKAKAAAKKSAAASGGAGPASTDGGSSASSADVPLEVVGDWEKHYDDGNKRAYWFNKKTSESSWSRPVTVAGVGEVNPDRVWEEHKDDTTNKVYFFNRSRRKSLWVRPEGPGEFVVPAGEGKATAPKAAKPDKWEKHVDDSSGRVYYFNKARRQSRWTPPPGFDAEST